MIQSLLAKLVHVSNCIQQARKFIVRIIATLRSITDDGWIVTSDEFCKDIQWFLPFASVSNGVLLYIPNREVFECECDSYLTAGGSLMSPYYYVWPHNDQHRQLYPAIHKLEAINLLITYRTFAPFISSDNACVIIYTDNIASSYVLEMGRTKDSTLASCARELWLMVAKRLHQISVRHKPGIQIQFVDALSRMHSDPLKAEIIHRTVNHNHLVS